MGGDAYISRDTTIRDEHIAGHDVITNTSRDTTIRDEHIAGHDVITNSTLSAQPANKDGDGTGDRYRSGSTYNSNNFAPRME